MIHTEISVNQFVTHSSNLFPRNIRIVFFDCVRNILDGLAYYFNCPDYSVNRLPVFTKPIERDPLYEYFDMTDRIRYKYPTESFQV